MPFIRVCFFLLLLFTAVVQAAPVINENYVNYKIIGHSANTLRQQMSMLGPTDVSSEHFDASTHWYIQWQYKYQAEADKCHLTEVNVKVDVTYQFPEWVDYAVSDYSLKTRWNTYMLHLLTHERGHAENGILAAVSIEQALTRLPAMQSCEILANTADNIAYQTIALHNTKDMNYENITHHGATQGATFP